MGRTTQPKSQSKNVIFFVPYEKTVINGTGPEMRDSGKCKKTGGRKSCNVPVRESEAPQTKYREGLEKPRNQHWP